MTLTTTTNPEFFLTDARCYTETDAVLNYKVYAVDEMGNRQNFNILVPYATQLNSQIEKFLLGATGNKWTVLSREMVAIQPDDAATETQVEFESYLDRLAEEITVSPEEEVKDLLTDAGYAGVAISLSDAFLKLYKVRINSQHGNYKDVVATGRMEDLPAKVRGFIKAEAFIKETRKRVLAGYGIAA